MNHLKLLSIAAGLTSSLFGACAHDGANRSSAAAAFMQSMHENHHFDLDYLDDVLQSAVIKQDILKRIQSPAESLPWYKYRKIFLTEARIKSGVEFWQIHADTLAAVERQYGVPAEIIIAILGIETLYGQKTGNHRIIDALSTLAFAYPPRSRFFSQELENFFLLCREENLDPLIPTGSYAGAMGMPQFMPSSYRSYAADFDQDGRRDIWHNPKDVIASIARYFVEHGWQRSQAIAFSAKASDFKYKSLLRASLKPDLRLDELKSAQVEISGQLPLDSQVQLLAFDQENGDELWVGLHNFYVITRYNHSALYAMAVFQLSEALVKYRPTSPYE